MEPRISNLKPADLRRRLLAWYDRRGRVLPWRAAPGTPPPDPYRVWLSEVMLQQTTVAAVIPYFEDFVGRWPSLGELAAADLDRVMHAWQGLGYYARARNLHRCARTVAGELGGRFPDTEAGLGRLPGIGPYTAAAVAAIAFGRRATPVDGNVVRVMARLHALEVPLPGAKAVVAGLAGGLTPARRPGDFAQAMMDLGATVCTPRDADCDACPWRRACAARRLGTPRAYPVRTPGRAKPLRRGVAFWVVGGEDAVLLRRRPERGLLGAMMEIPSTAWREAPWTPGEARPLAPLAASWERLPGTVGHVFTHFRLELEVWAARIDGRPRADGLWWPVERLSEQALPTVMKKIVRHALEKGAPP